MNLPEVCALPRDFRGVHPTWLAGIDVSTPAGVWQARWLDLPPLPSVRPGPPRNADHLVALADPLPFLVARGRDHLAFATGLSTGLLAGAKTTGQGDRRAAITRCQGVQLDELGLIRVGARTLSLSRLQQRQLCVRLPKKLGEAIARELAHNWGAPVPF